VLEDCVRAHLNEAAPRRIAVLHPLKLIIDNYPEGQSEKCSAPNHPQQPGLGTRELLFARELWIEREDFMVAPSKGYFRLYRSRVRLRYGYVVECTGFDQDASGQVTAVHCRYFADSHSGSTGADQYKVKGNVHWVAVQNAFECEVRLYDRLFRVPNPGAGERDFLQDLNPESKRVIRAQLEPAQQSAAGDCWQFRRHAFRPIEDSQCAPVFNHRDAARFMGKAARLMTASSIPGGRCSSRWRSSAASRCAP
jgi:glutaminyl-tRNA synthetase